MGQGLRQQLRHGEAGHAQEICGVRLRLGGAEIRQGARRQGQQDGGIPLLHPAGHGRGGIAAQPHAGHHEAAQHVAQLADAPAVLQGEEGRQIAAGLAGAHGGGGGQMAQMMGDGAVVVPREQGLVGVGQLCRRPAPPQHLLGVVQSQLRLLYGPHGVGDDRGEAVAALRPQHVLPPPGAHPAGADGAEGGDGQQLLGLLPGPAPAEQQAHGPEFLLLALAHGHPSSAFF